MQIQFKVNPKLIITLEGDKETDVFEQLASVQEVFGQNTCGKCGCEDCKFVVRSEKEENKYYEMRCPQCHAALSFGCHKKGGGLFPKRKDEEGKWIGSNGWGQWNPETKKKE